MQIVAKEFGRGMRSKQVGGNCEFPAPMASSLYKGNSSKILLKQIPNPQLGRKKNTQHFVIFVGGQTLLRHDISEERQEN